MAYIYNINDNWIEKLPDPTIFTCNKSSKYKEKYYNFACGFDIETTSIIKGESKHSYMYVWQFIIEDILIIGRTWNDFFRLLDILIDKYNHADYKLLVFIHNIGYEASFLLSRIWPDITNSFYKDKRKPLFFEYKDKIRFQDSYAITGCSLEKTSDIYGLTTKKLVGALDYSLTRNSQTELSEREKMYIYNDVLILRDFARKLIDEIIPKNYNKLPLTKTQLFLNKVFHYMTKKEKMRCHDILLTFNEYHEMNRWLFRGGYVHGNCYWIDQIIYDVQSVDFTSSYPATMLHHYAPVGKFRNVNIEILTMEIFRNLLNNYCCWIDMTFYDIKVTTNHTIESRSKIIKATADAVYDNGRLYSAGCINVQLTELDFDIYGKFYQWESMQVNSIKIARRGKLPDGLLKALKEDYVIKAKLKVEDKKDTIDYILAKQNINSAYGACCKKVPFKNWIFSNGDWNVSNVGESEADVYTKWTEKTNILPFQFACWITSHSRHNLLSAVYKVGNDAIYEDTDSIKIVNYEKHRKVVSDYNEKMKQLNAELVKESEYFSDLGEFDENDGHYSEFKVLGCKRYVIKEDEKAHATIAGLPKKALIKYCDNNNIDIMEAFNDGLVLQRDESMKITTHYNDEPHSDIVTDYQGHTERMEELSSCTLYEIPFNLSLTSEYVSFLSKVIDFNKMYLS